MLAGKICLYLVLSIIISSAGYGQQPSVYPIRVINGIDVGRSQEIMEYNLFLEDSVLLIAEADTFSVYNVSQEPPFEVISDYDAYSLILYPSGYVELIKILFQDDIGAKDTSYYEVRLFDSTNIDAEIISLIVLDEDSSEFIIDNNSSTYLIRHELPTEEFWGGPVPEKFTRHLTIEFSKDSSLAVYQPLNWIGGNLLELADLGVNHYIFSYGVPSKVNITTNRLQARMTFEYNNALLNLAAWDGSEDTTFQTDIVSANIELIFYRNRTNVSVKSQQKVSTAFYNHNFFKTEISYSNLEGCLLYFGNDIDQIIDCGRPNAQWMQYDRDIGFPFIESADNAGHTPFDTLAVAGTFKNYYVWENKYDKATMIYIPDWKEIAYTDKYLDQNNFSITRNSLYINSVLVERPSVSHLLSSTGPGAGWIPVLIDTGTYISESVFYPYLDWTTDFAIYDQVLERITQSIIVEERVTTSVTNYDNIIIQKYMLGNNYPNPFNPTATIEYSLPLPGEVSLIVYNLLGQEVAKLVSDEIEAGYHKVTWNASNFPSGIYFYRLQAGDFVQTRKMVLLK